MEASTFGAIQRDTAEQAQWQWGEGGFHCARRCRTTHWSLVFALAAEGEPARAALGKLYRQYWHPVHAFLLRRHGGEKATELAQGFFARLVDSGDLKRVERRPGQRFRGWLFKALQRFVFNQWRYERQEQRDVRKTMALGSDVDEGSNPPRSLVAQGQDPERLLQRARVLALLSDVLGRLRREYCAQASKMGVDGVQRFEALKVFLPGPDTESADYGVCAEALGMTPDAVKQAVRRLRVRFASLLHDVIRQSVGSDAEVAEARRLLCAALETPQPGPDGA